MKTKDWASRAAELKRYAQNTDVNSPDFWRWLLGEYFMSKKVVMFEYEKETKNSVRYKEVPDEGTAPIVGTLYVQKWFAGNSKSIEITIDKKD
ncbi:MAG: hypothetical protein V7760_04220 [Marinobacter sp.]